jgi:4-amino-4-deoxy-L-arabinose transferase-like glycosyltransferase
MGIGLTDKARRLSKRFAGLSFHRQLLAVTAIGMSLRIVWALLVPNVPLSDAYIYFATARNIVESGFYGIEANKPFAYWPMGASLIYAAGFAVFGVHAWSATLVNLVAGALSVWTTGLLARRWFDGKVAIVASTIVAVWPSLIMYATIMASEIFFIVLVNIALLMWSEKNAPLKSGLLAGAAIGAAIAVRPVALLAPFVFAIASALGGGFSRRSVAMLFATIIAAAAVVAPISAYNSARHGAFVLVSTNAGANLWMGNNPQSTGGYMDLPSHVEGLTELQRDEVLRAEARAFITENPGKTIQLFFRKLVDTHIRETIAVHWNASGITHRFGASALAPIKLVCQASWMAIFAFAIVGVALCVRRAFASKSVLSVLGAIAWPPALTFWAYYAFVHAVTVSQDRYHLQAANLIAMLAAIAVIALLNRIRHLGARNPSVSDSGNE